MNESVALYSYHLTHFMRITITSLKALTFSMFKLYIFLYFGSLIIDTFNMSVFITIFQHGTIRRLILTVSIFF